MSAERIEINGHLIEETHDLDEPINGMGDYEFYNPYLCRRCNSRFMRLPTIKCTGRHIGPNIYETEIGQTR